MYTDFIREMNEVRVAEYRAEAERRRLYRLAKGKERFSWRRWTARRLFDAAFALETEESWRAIWDRMSGKQKRKRRLSGKRRYAR